MTKRKHTRTLVLNADFTAHSVIDWQRAVILASMNQNDPKEGASVIDFYKDDAIVDASGKKYPVPAVLLLARYIHKKSAVPFSRKNVFIRDKLTCQYCGEVKLPKDLTYDHVIPRCRWSIEKFGTPTHWLNIVTCCIKCNKRKANKTPKEAGMHLMKEPKQPTGAHFIHGLSPWSKIEDEWKIYLPALYTGQV